MSRPEPFDQRRRVWLINLAGRHKDEFIAPSNAYGTEIERHAISFVRRLYPGCGIILPTSPLAPYDFRFQPVNPGPMLYAEVKSHRERRGYYARTWWSIEEYTHAKKHGRLIIVCVPGNVSRRILSNRGRVRDITWYAYRFTHTDLPKWESMLRF